jgi:hypothetical protein
MRERYVDKKFQKQSLTMIERCNDIIEEFAGKGHKMTIRQLYYQLVARGVIGNTIQNYDNIVALMTNARLAGLVDWDAIEDRTREFIDRSHWYGVKTMLRSAADWYHENMWEEQESPVFCVVEKEALAGIFEHLFHKWDIPVLPARGYPSATALREFAKRRIMPASQQVVVLHFGDHDPSGIDMSRDLQERLELFSRQQIHIDFRRLALNMDQVEELNPPPYPCKVKDSRTGGYRALYGDKSWELDALSPEYLQDLIDRTVEPLIDWDQWNATERRIERRRAVLQRMTDAYDANDGTDFDPETEE